MQFTWAVTGIRDGLFNEFVECLPVEICLVLACQSSAPTPEVASSMFFLRYSSGGVFGGYRESYMSSASSRHNGTSGVLDDILFAFRLKPAPTIMAALPNSRSHQRCSRSCFMCPQSGSVSMLLIGYYFLLQTHTQRPYPPPLARIEHGDPYNRPFLISDYKIIIRKL